MDATPTNGLLLATEKLVKQYRGRRVVNEVSVGVSAGEIVGLPESHVSGVTLRNVKIEAQHGLMIRYAEVSGTGFVVESHDGTPINKQADAVVSLH